MNKNKAIHVGSCQCCGHEQKLPKGMLSKHGYDVRWGFFNGVCLGAGSKPYEQDCSLIQEFIDRAKSSLADVEAEIVKDNLPATEPKCWYNEYVGGKGRLPSHYEWRKVELILEYVRPEWVEAGRAGWYTLYFTNHEGKKERFMSKVAYSVEEALTFATEQNHSHIEYQLEPRKRELQHYIAWQQERVDKWVLKELKPVPPPEPKDPNRVIRRRRW